MEEEQSFEEWEEFLDADIQAESAEFEAVIREFGLATKLSAVEVKLLLRLWQAANGTGFLINISPETTRPKREIHEDAVGLSEAEFLKMREYLFATPGWKALPRDIQLQIQTRLFDPKIDDENLAPDA